MTADLMERILQSFSQGAYKVVRLTGGDVGVVYKATLKDETAIVAKVDIDNPWKLEREANMLKYLGENTRLPVPAVLSCDGGYLFLEFLPGNSIFSADAQEHAAELLADLHQKAGPDYGFEVDTLIGGLEQPNQWSDSWMDFFREQRLLYMAREAAIEGSLPRDDFLAIGRLCDKLDNWLSEPQEPSLIHGDAWTGNILCAGGRITGFLDPAIYFADPEIELAFMTLFNTFGEPFFRRYDEILPITPGFVEVRRDIYSLYPLLVHLRLFGGGYLESVRKIVNRFGY